MPIELTSIPSDFISLGTECTQTNQFVDQALLYALHSNHNFLAAKRVKNTAFAAPSIISNLTSTPFAYLSNIYELSSERAEIDAMMTIALRKMVRRVTITISGNANSGVWPSGAKVYPVLTELGLSREISTSKYLTVGPSATTDSVTIHVPETRTSHNAAASFNLFTLGFVIEPKTTTSVYASAALTAIDRMSFNTATIGASAVGNAVYVDSDSTIEMRRITRAGGVGYVLDRPWSKTPDIAADSVTVVTIPKVSIDNVSIIEAVETSPFVSVEGL